jgi:3-hydroxybutyryl-CoA dehydrogenase
MKILARGEKIKVQELKQWFSSDVELDVLDDTDLTAHNLQGYDVIFDLDFDSYPHQLKYFAHLSIPIIVGATKIQLSGVVREFGRAIQCKLFGINAIPTFIQRNVAELSAYNLEDKSELEQIFGHFSKKIHWVEDRVGMVSPRIIFMIINEACYTVQEGTASIHDIDISMKLGTNYPYGPFEWADKIGVKYVYENLMAMYEDTKDTRYKICPLLKTHYLKNQTFL